MRWPNGGVGQRKSGFAVAWVIGLTLCLARSAQAQDAQGFWERTNTLGIFAAWSNDSSHMLLGHAERRKLLETGVVYNRRILVGHGINWQYSGEFLPLVLESDPLTQEIDYETSPQQVTYTFENLPPMASCTPFSEPYQGIAPDGTVFSGTEVYSCHGRRWAIGEGMSPIGFQWNFRPRSRLQPFVAGHGGYLYSSKSIPMEGAGTFNFTFDFGVGLEWFRTAKRSWRIEYRYHHISNAGVTYQDPGIDNGVLQVTYAFGR